ncbi:hypothetical protein RHSIM_Rhsim01G0137100 [Rhododendron simsii]|uniref:Glycosyltransferase n=1 Tax=Rhododendron simsii TaxID=118357 RepID=A0A834HG66_RHOSS|nr:hypothetical protein RHSIM_Rhsim01G0137100 [Rhododendron simsii]
MENQTPHISLLPSPGMGHLIPFIQLAKRLLHHHHISSTIIIPASGPPSNTQTTLLQSLPEPISHILLPPVLDLPKNIRTESQITLTVIRSLPSLRGTLDTLRQTTRLAALVVDPFCLSAFDVARELGVKPYLFFTAGAMTLSFCLLLPKLDKMVTCEYRDLTDPIELPGCVPVHGRDLLDPVQDRSNDAYKHIKANTERFAWAEGIILNSFLDLEEGAIRALEMEEPGKPPVYSIGPLVHTDSSYESDRPECLKWLDSQPDGSVLFISFGSGGTLSHAQINELALGLEMSGHKFLWVVRTPNEKSANAAYFSDQGQNDPLSFLPNGFLERTKGMGLVVPSWAPQIEVLSHGSTGGFLTHCGWNSILESTVHGVPLIAWPLYAEQKMNAAMLTEGVNVALRPKVNENGIVGREEIARVVKDLMEGDDGTKVRLRMQGLKHAGAQALSEDGSSSKSLSNLAFRLKNNRNI